MEKKGERVVTCPLSSRSTLGIGGAIVGFLGKLLVVAPVPQHSTGAVIDRLALRRVLRDEVRVVRGDPVRDLRKLVLDVGRELGRRAGRVVLAKDAAGC